MDKEKMPKKSDTPKTKVAKTDAIILAGKHIGESEQNNVSDSIAQAIGVLNSERVSFADSIEAHLSWDDEAPHLDSRELADYLLSFTRMYSAASQLSENDALNTGANRELFERGLPRPRPMDSFNILRISYASPLEIVVGGIAVGIALAVVLSGGHFEMTSEDSRPRCRQLEPALLLSEELWLSCLAGRRPMMTTSSTLHDKLTR